VCFCACWFVCRRLLACLLACVPTVGRVLLRLLDCICLTGLLSRTLSNSHSFTHSRTLLFFPFLLFLLASLRLNRKLFEEGFITKREYEIRKKEAVDRATGTCGTPTRTTTAHSHSTNNTGGSGKGRYTRVLLLGSDLSAAEPIAPTHSRYHLEFANSSGALPLDTCVRRENESAVQTPPCTTAPMALYQSPVPLTQLERQAAHGAPISSEQVQEEELLGTETESETEVEDPYDGVAYGSDVIARPPPDFTLLRSERAIKREFHCYGCVSLSLSLEFVTS
jgi:hypothetical protein